MISSTATFYDYDDVISPIVQWGSYSTSNLSRYVPSEHDTEKIYRIDIDVLELLERE